MMDSDTEKWFDSVEQELRSGTDKSELLDELLQFSFLGDEDERIRTSWCVAKMAQNKIQDMRILSILSSMGDDSSEEVRENVAWGLGELAGYGFGDFSTLEIVKTLMRDNKTVVRSMAAWAAGRFHHRLNIFDDESVELLKKLAEDRSELVRKSAVFALNDE